MKIKICKTKRENVIACGIEKYDNEFYSGSSLCKECSKQLNSLRKEYQLEYSKKHYQENKGYYKKKSEEYREDNKEYFKKYREDNKEKLNEGYKKYYKLNKEKVQEKNKKWREDNIDKHREYNKISVRNDRKNNPHKYRWRYLLKNTLSKLGKKKENNTSELLCYSPIELKTFLETINKNWFEFEIDHKIPITWFKPDTPPNIVNNFRNLQLLNKGENSSKRNFYMDNVSNEFLDEIKQYVKDEYIGKKSGDFPR